METIFLSYTYNPHPDYKAATDSMERNLRRVIETFGLRVVDGVNVGGKPLRPEIRKRIDSSDALIALITPKSAQSDGEVAQPEFVISEFLAANGGQPRLQIVHETLPVPAGLGAEDEYAPYRIGAESDVLLKVMNTIALWKRERGRTVKLGIEPCDLIRRFETSRDICQFQRLSDTDGVQTIWQPSQVWIQKGSAIVLVPNVRDDQFVRIRVRIANDPWWMSEFTQPFVGTATLEKQP